MKRNIEIEDSLQERVDGAIEEVKDLLLEYLKDNEPSCLPCLNNDLDYSGSVHEIVDSSVPIYTKEIEDTWYLHSNRLEEAYENAGVGSNPRENDGMAAIYFYIMDKVQEWYNDEAQEIFEEWEESKDLREFILSEGFDVKSDKDGFDLTKDGKIFHESGETEELEALREFVDVVKEANNSN